MRTLQSLLAEYEPTGLRAFRTSLTFFAGFLLLAWVCVAAIFFSPGLRSYLESEMPGSAGTALGLVLWLTWELAIVAVLPVVAVMYARVFGGFGLVPFLLAFLATGLKSLLHFVPIAIALSVVFGGFGMFLGFTAPSLGDTPEDETFGRTTEAMAWLVFWARGKWDGPALSLLKSLLRHFHIRRLRLRLEMLRLHESFFLQDGTHVTPRDSAEELAEPFASAARKAGLPDPEISLLGVLLESVQVLGNSTDEQVEYLNALGQRLGLDEALLQVRIETARELARPMSPKEAAKRLGVRLDAEREEIEEAFRLAVERSGPDAVPILAKARSLLLSKKK